MRIYDGDETFHGFSSLDGDKEATIRDADGSLTSYPGTQIVRPRPFFLTPECVIRKRWNLALCPHSYIKAGYSERGFSYIQLQSLSYIH